MKKIYCLLFCISFINPLLSSAQETKPSKETKKFTLGLNIGGHRSSLGGDGAFGQFYHKNQFNYTFGINAELKANKDWSFYANLNYKPKYFSNETTLTSPSGPVHSEAEFRFSYLELPIMMKYRIPNSFFYTNGGLYFGRLLSLKYYENGNDTGQNWIGDFNKLDFGLVIGAGFIFYENEKETANWSLEARYVHGLSDISDQEGNGSNVNNCFSLQLNYNFTP